MQARAVSLFCALTQRKKTKRKGIAALREQWRRKKEAQRKREEPEWALHLPMKICSSLILLNRSINSDPSDKEINERAKALFTFNR
jgi:hypothetical protein